MEITVKFDNKKSYLLSFALDLVHILCDRTKVRYQKYRENSLMHKSNKHTLEI